jgi:hypothetical protein
MSALRAPARTAIPNRGARDIDPAVLANQAVLHQIVHDVRCDQHHVDGSPPRTRATIAWAPRPVDVASVTAVTFRGGFESRNDLQVRRRRCPRRHDPHFARGRGGLKRSGEQSDDGKLHISVLQKYSAMVRVTR